MTIDGALAICAERFLTREEVASLCAATDSDVNAALDALAREVASRYLQGAAGFTTADTLMNDLFTHAAIHSDLPPTFMRVYEAFDQGEYRHEGDEDGIDAEAVYTKPMLSALISDGLLPNTSLERTPER
jgi:hypothetical protein